MNLTFNINKFNLIYEDVDKLSIRPSSEPFYIPGDSSEMMVRVNITLSRSGYEVNNIESRQLVVPYSMLEIFARFKAGISTENDVNTLNSFISQINPSIVIDIENPILEIL